MRIVEVERLLSHPNLREVGRTLRIYFEAGLRITYYRDPLRCGNKDGLTMSWNNCAPELPEEIIKLIEPVLKENRAWLWE